MKLFIGQVLEVLWIQEAGFSHLKISMIILANAKAWFPRRSVNRMWTCALAATIMFPEFDELPALRKAASE